MKNDTSLEARIDELCSICFGTLKEPMETPCNHKFCRKCIEEWLETADTCPIYCQNITLKELKSCGIDTNS